MARIKDICLSFFYNKRGSFVSQKLSTYLYACLVSVGVAWKSPFIVAMQRKGVGREEGYDLLNLHTSH